MHIYVCIYTARTDVLPGKVRFDWAGPMFCEILRVVHLGQMDDKNLLPHFCHFFIIIIIIMNHETLNETLKKHQN